MKATFDQVENILSKYIMAEEIGMESVLTSDLGLSSFELVSIVSDFEDEFDIEISDADLRNFISVNDILKYLNARL